MAMSGGGEGSMEPQSLEMSGEENIGEEALVGELLEEEPSLAEQNATLADWLMNFLATANPESSEALETFDASMELIVQWCLDNFSDEEKTALIQRLNEPGFSFASAIGQEAAANLVTALGQ